VVGVGSIDETGQPKVATDGLLCLLLEVLPVKAKSCMSGDEPWLEEWLQWVVSHLASASTDSQSGERWRLASRSLAVLIAVLQASPSRPSGPAAALGVDAGGVRGGWVLRELLGRSTLLRIVLDVIVLDRDSLDAAAALDDYAASEASSAAGRLILLGNKPSDGLWGWWRQRAVVLALSLLLAAAEREDALVESWASTRKQVPRLLVTVRFKCCQVLVEFRVSLSLSLSPR
jgi:hypothetical protein